MTKRQLLIKNIIELRWKQVAFDFTISSEDLDLKMKKLKPVITKLRKRLAGTHPRTVKTKTDSTFFGRTTVYADGTKHTINNSWWQ